MSVSIILLIIEYLLITILSKLILFQIKNFSRDKFVIFKHVCKKLTRVFLQDENFDLIFSTSLQKFIQTFLQDAKIVLVFLTIVQKFSKYFSVR